MIQTFYRRLTRFFSRQELWYLIGMMPIQVPIGNYYFIGSRYFSNWRLFLMGTGVILGLYILAAFLITALIQWTIRRYPTVIEARRRTLVMLTLSGLLTFALVLLDVWVYSWALPREVSFSWTAIRPILLAGLVCDFILCMALNTFYTYTQWKKEQGENKELKETALHHQLDALKMQISPHFLFNSLNSLSSLIGEDQQKAEHFVDGMAKVYRYLLQANNRALVGLETEISFINSYTYLLRTRYGKGISVNIDVNVADNTYYLPPLTLQTLIENALKQNSILTSRPLFIEIRLAGKDQLMVRNTIQKRPVRVESNGVGLSNVVAKYALLGKREVLVQHTDTHFTVFLPLLLGQQLMKEA